MARPWGPHIGRGEDPSPRDGKYHLFHKFHKFPKISRKFHLFFHIEKSIPKFHEILETYSNNLKMKQGHRSPIRPSQISLSEVEFVPAFFARNYKPLQHIALSFGFNFASTPLLNRTAENG